MRKQIIISAAVISAVLMIPFPIQLKDGGTVRYKAALYMVEKPHAITEKDDKMGFTVGTRLYIFGKEVYENVQFQPITQ